MKIQPIWFTLKQVKYQIRFISKQMTNKKKIYIKKKDLRWQNQLAFQRMIQVCNRNQKENRNYKTQLQYLQCTLSSVHCVREA